MLHSINHEIIKNTLDLKVLYFMHTKETTPLRGLFVEQNDQIRLQAFQ